MFFPGKAAVTLTPAAVERIRAVMASSGDDVIGLRVSVKKGGCAGMEYALDYATGTNPHDEVIEQDGVRVIIPAMAAMFLIGTTIDYEEGLIDSGFRFHNPNVVESCGCGESVKFAEPAR